jgi:hypothetical protein
MGPLPLRRTLAACTATPFLVACLALGSLLYPASAHAQPFNNGISYADKPTFRIPFDIDGADRTLQEVQLWISEDQGQTWRNGGAVSPSQRGFDFRADHDGLYWFIARTVSTQGQAHPVNLQSAPPGLKVCVDTKPPTVVLRQASAREGLVAVDWDIREENLDLSSFSLDYRTPSSPDWIPLPVEPAANGQRAWSAEPGPVEVRLRVRDLAKNPGEAKITLGPGGAHDSRLNYQDSASSRLAGRGAAVGTRWVNSKRISLNYKLQEKGPSGVSAVELWMTRDTRMWDRYKVEKVSEDQAADDPNRTLTYVFDVQDEGKYGFTIVPRSGVDRSHPPPHSGDQPQIWVEVDTTKPVIEWLNVDVGRGPDKGTLTITWKASDRNLARQPITLSYAKEATGPWTSIESNVENTGRYVWRMPPAVPYSFFVRIEAVDLAKNVGTLDTPRPVLVDLAEPKSLILGADPADKLGGP